MTPAQPAGLLIPTWTIADRLRKAREMTGLKQADFGDQINLAKSSVVDYESDARIRPRNPRTLRLWADRANVAFEWLAFGQGEPTDPEGGEDQGIPSSECVTGDEALILRFPTARVDENLAA